MAQVSPVVIEEHDHISFRLKGTHFVNLTMSLDKYISYYDDKDNKLVVLDLEEPFIPIKIPFEGYRGIVNPLGGIIAIMGKDMKTLTIFNMETNTIVKRQKLKEDLSFWKWISPSTIAVVTKTSVYHWDVFVGHCGPVKMFDRHDSLAGMNNLNLNYVVDASENWLLLAGTSKVSALQLYSVERNLSQIISGYKAVFCQFQMQGNFEFSNLLCYVEDKKPETKLVIMEVGSFPNLNEPFPKKVATVALTEGDEEGDIDTVIGMQVSQKYGLIFLITLYGYVHLYDIETAQCIFSDRICKSELDYGEFFFDTAPCEETEGVITVNMKGQVISVSISENNLSPYLKNMKRNVQLATRLLERQCNQASASGRNNENDDEDDEKWFLQPHPRPSANDDYSGVAARVWDLVMRDNNSPQDHQDSQEGSRDANKQNKKKKKKKKKANTAAAGAEVKPSPMATIPPAQAVNGVAAAEIASASATATPITESSGNCVAADVPPPRTIPPTTRENGATANVAPAAVPPATVPPATVDDDIEEKKQCIICYEREFNTVLIPCGHMWLCFECATDIKDENRPCPACRAKVDNIFRVYTPE